MGGVHIDYFLAGRKLDQEDNYQGRIPNVDDAVKVQGRTYIVTRRNWKDCVNPFDKNRVVELVLKVA